MNNKGKGKRSAILEAVIILLIGAGLIFLNLYTENLFRELHQAGQSAVFVMDDTTFENEDEFAEKLTEYLPSSYKMIELYDENIDLLFQIQFNDKIENTEDIHDHPNMMNFFKANQEGQTKIMIDDVEQNVYFKWMDNTRGEHRLLVVYSSIETVQGIWVFHLVSYVIIALVFALLLVLSIRRHNDTISAYKVMIDNELDELR